MSDIPGYVPAEAILPVSDEISNPADAVLTELQNSQSGAELKMSWDATEVSSELKYST